MVTDQGKTSLPYASCSLQKYCCLAQDVPLNATHEGSHGWVVTLGQRLQPVVPILNAVGAASCAVRPCSMLIPGFIGEYGFRCDPRLTWSVGCLLILCVAARRHDVINGA